MELSAVASNPPDWTEMSGTMSVPGCTLEVWASNCSEQLAPCENDVESNNTQQRQEITGMVCVPVCINRGMMSEKRSLLLLSDFRALWKHTAEDTIDEVAAYAPLFRMYMELCFHKRTAQIVVVTTVWYLVVTIVANSVYPAFSAFQQAVYYFYVISAALVYFALAVLFKGVNVFGDSLAGSRIEVEDDDSRGIRKREVHHNPSVSWRIRALDAARATVSEIADLWRGERKPGHAPNSAVALPHVAFYEALNIGLKFLSKRKLRSYDTLLNTRANSLKLMFIFIGAPLYTVLWNFVSFSGTAYTYLAACDDDASSSLCKNFTLVMILTGGSAVAMVQKCIFISAVLLSLVGLHFGAEVGRGLVDSWISRFGLLRHVKACDHSDLKVSDGPPTTLAQSAAEQPAAAPEAETVSPLAVLSALHSAEANAPTPPSGSLSETAGDKGQRVTVPEKVVLSHLPRDAYEHYLFMREFMSTGSRAWSPIIVTLSFLNAFYVLLFCYGAATVTGQLSAIDWAYYTAWIVVRVLLLMVYPIVSLARANAYVYALQEQFLGAAPEDFAVLGGRDGWLDYLNKVPATWTIYGVWVTWERLTGALWAVVATLGALAITYASTAFT